MPGLLPASDHPWTRRDVILRLVALSGLSALVVARPSAQQAVFMCPMHPDQRGPKGGTCPRCGMPLVAMEPPTVGAYVLDIEMKPALVRPGEPLDIEFLVRHPVTGALVHRFELMHERIFHLFVVSHDLEYFAHVHPTQTRSGKLKISLTVPVAGAYQLIADFLPAGGSPQLIQRSFLTAGYDGPLANVPVLAMDSGDKIVSGTHVRLTMPDPIAGREQLITFHLTDADDGAPIHDLEMFLGAPGHLLLVSADLSVAMHQHPTPELAPLRDSSVVFQVLFPRRGMYRLWAQFQRSGRIITVPFTVGARDAA